jgi:membrane associated rhomboid family serine protease
MKIMAAKKNSRFLSEDNPLLQLVFLNMLFFALLHFIKIAYVLSNETELAFTKQVYNYFIMPADMIQALRQPWAIITHMFVQMSIWGLIGNMFFLWSFGFLLRDLTGNRHIYPLYLYGGIAGLLFFMSAIHLIPRFSETSSFQYYLGPGAALMGVALGITTLSPSYRVFPMINGGIPLWVITLVFSLIHFAGLSTMSFPFHFAAIGGASAGFAYMTAIKKGKDPGSWMHFVYEKLKKIFTFRKNTNNGNSMRERVFYKSGEATPYKKIAERTEKKIDAILDKINLSGYDSLSNEEKAFLKRASDTDNKN